MSVEVSIEGLDRWLEICDPVRLTNEIDKAVQQSAVEVAKITQSMPPVNRQNNGWDAKGIPVAPLYGGSLRQSIHAQRIGLMAAGVVTGVGYGQFVHGGTSVMPPRPYYLWALEDFGGLDAIDIVVSAALDRVVNP